MTTRPIDATPAPPELDADATTLTAALVAVPSVNPALEAGGTGEAAIAARVAGWLEGWGFEVSVEEAAPGRPNVVGRLRRGRGRRLVLNGHLDTVGVAGMTVPAFGAPARDGRLYGRGACDMKSGIAALLAAARDAGRGLEPGARTSGGGNGPAFHGELIVALVADEEHGSVGMEALVEAGLEADGAVVCEPTELTIMPAHKGFVWVEVNFRGRAAHGSRPDRGVDAIRHAGRFLARLDELDAELTARSPHPLLGHGSVHAGTVAGGTAPPVYPDSCRLVLERRTLPGETLHGVRAEIEGLLQRLAADVPDLEGSVSLGLARAGTEVPGDAPVVRALGAALADEGREPAVQGMTAWVDAALLNEAGIPAICFGPGSIENAHAADEFVHGAEIEAAHAVLLRFIHRFLAQ